MDEGVTSWERITALFQTSVPDGKVKVTDFEAVLTVVEPSKSETWKTLAQLADKNGDGVIDLRQLLSWLRGPEECFRSAISEFMNKVDEPEHTATAAKKILQAEMEQWWKTSAAYDLHDLIDDSEFELRDAWAEQFVKFISLGFLGVNWEAKDSARAKEVETKEDIIAKYKKRLGARKDVAADNLYNIKLRVDETFDKAAKVENLRPEVKTLLKALAEAKPSMKWSQGGFGPKAYDPEFLTTYANTMLSGSLWTQDPKTYVPSFAKNNTFLECGIFYVDTGVEYPLHYHEELEAYYILYGKTRFFQLLNGKLIAIDREAGEWHFNPPYVPHSITSPFATPHLSLWFREGGPGQEANNKFGPKWICSCEGLEVTYEENFDSDTENDIPVGVYHDSVDMKGAADFGKSTKLQEGKHFFRTLTPQEFMTLEKDPNALRNVDSLLTPDAEDDLEELLAKLQNGSHKHKRPFTSCKKLYHEHDA